MKVLMMRELMFHPRRLPPNRCQAPGCGRIAWFVLGDCRNAEYAKLCSHHGPVWLKSLNQANTLHEFVSAGTWVN
jgi:hypothetical protein